ncbi:unnamed protein product [Calypogeia fissa]
MATVAAIRAAAAPSSALSSSRESIFSPKTPHSDCRNGAPICAMRASMVLISTSSSPTAATAALSSSRSYVPLVSSSKQFKEVNSRRRDATRASGASTSPRCESDSNNTEEEKTPFGYTRKDVILIGVGLIGVGFALKYGLELFGVDSIKAGNAVQLIMVLGLTVGWISTYVFRVSSKEMTYAKQLKDYENKVMEKRLEEMPEAELESMLAQIEEDKRILRESRDKIF